MRRTGTYTPRRRLAHSLRLPRPPPPRLGRPRPRVRRLVLPPHRAGRPREGPHGELRGDRSRGRDDGRAVPLRVRRDAVRRGRGRGRVGAAARRGGGRGHDGGGRGALRVGARPARRVRSAPRRGRGRLRRVHRNAQAGGRVVEAGRVRHVVGPHAGRREPRRAPRGRAARARRRSRGLARDVRRRGGAVARPRGPLPRPRPRPARGRGLSAAGAARNGPPRLGGGGLSHRLPQPEDVADVPGLLLSVRDVSLLLRSLGGPVDAGRLRDDGEGIRGDRVARQHRRHPRRAHGRLPLRQGLPGAAPPLHSVHAAPTRPSGPASAFPPPGRRAACSGRSASSWVSRRAASRSRGPSRAT